jgi:hypothetical protein
VKRPTLDGPTVRTALGLEQCGKTPLTEPLGLREWTAAVVKLVRAPTVVVPSRTAPRGFERRLTFSLDRVGSIQSLDQGSTIP